MASVMDSVNQRTQLAGHNRLELLMFRLNGRQRFGINVFKIQEVVQCPPLNHIPQSHPHVRGVATMRGKTIPVIDLSLAIGKTPIEGIADKFLIVAEYNRSVQGFLVGSVDRIVNLNWEDILPPPKGSGRNSYLTAVTQLEKELIEIIDVEKVLAEVTNTKTDVSEDLLASVDDLIKEQHVLVVDDSSVARNQIKRTLEQLGLNIVVANNGRDALNILKGWAANEDPILETLAMVISDVEMPEMDGYTLTTEIRKNTRLAGLYIMLHSSLSGTFNQTMVKSVGADRFIPKFKPDELAGEVIEHVREFVSGRG